MSLFGGVQAVSILLGLVRTKAIALLLGPVGVGFISVFNTASAFLQNATNMGLQMSGTREVAQEFESGDAERLFSRITTIRSWSMIVALLGLVVGVVAAPLFSLWAFSGYEHTFDFVLLAPVVACASISGGELSVLKATHQLKAVAAISVGGVAMMLLVSIPIYVVCGNSGIVPSLLIVSVLQLVMVLLYSNRKYKYRLSFAQEHLSAGRTLLKVGIAFTVAGVLGSGSEFFIRAHLSEVSVSFAGLYNAGYMLVMMCSGIVLASLESHFYPRLSAVCRDRGAMNTLVNEQIESALTILSPVMTVFVVAAPLVVPLLYSRQFLPVVAMAQVASIGVLMRAVYLPLSYINLAKGDAWAYVTMELVYYLILLLGIIVGFGNLGIVGTGVALAVTGVLHTVLLVAFCVWRHGFEMSDKLLKYILLHIIICVVTLIAATSLHGWQYWLAGLMMVAVCAVVSLRNMRKEIYAKD